MHQFGFVLRLDLGIHMLRELKMMFAHRNGLGSLDLGVDVSILSIRITYSIDRGKQKTADGKERYENASVANIEREREREKTYHFQ